MPVGMDDDLDEVGVVERAGRALERRDVEGPGRRPLAPQQARDAATIFGESAATAFAVKVILIPERCLFGWRRRFHRMGDILDVVRIAGHEGDDPPRPKRCDNAGRASAPVVAAEDRLLDLKRVHERQKVCAERGLLPRARRQRRQEPRGPEAAQIGDDDQGPGFNEGRRRLCVGVRVIGKAVAEDAGPTVGGTVLLVGDAQNARVDGFEGHLLPLDTA